MSSADYNGDRLVALSIVFLSLTYISVGLRFFVRIKLTKAFQGDDWLMLISQVVFTLSCAFILRGIHYGLGHHNHSLSQENSIQALKYQALATLTYIANMMFIKLSICVLLLRIAVQKRYVWILRISMVIVTLFSIGIFLYDLFECTPVPAQWDFTILGARCVSTDSVVSAAYAVSAMTILTDWLYALIPIPMIWNVNMSHQAKFTVGIILSLGVFASVATLIRIKFLANLTDLDDILYAGTDPMIWTLVEPGVAITAAALVTIRPLLRALNLSGFSSSHQDTSRTNPNTLSLNIQNDIPSDHWQNSAIYEGSESERFGDGEQGSRVEKQSARVQVLGSGPGNRHESQEMILGSDADRDSDGSQRTFFHDGRDVEGGSWLSC